MNWSRCTSVKRGLRCTRQAGHVGRHHSTWREWGTEDE